MILSDEYLKEFSPETGEAYTELRDVFLKHEKCGERSPENLNLYGQNEWAEKHKYECPEIAVPNITAGLGDQHVVVYQTDDGRTVVETWLNSERVKSVTRKLIPTKMPDDKK